MMHTKRKQILYERRHLMHAAVKCCRLQGRCGNCLAAIDVGHGLKGRDFQELYGSTSPSATVCLVIPSHICEEYDGNWDVKIDGSEHALSSITRVKVKVKLYWDAVRIPGKHHHRK